LANRDLATLFPGGPLPFVHRHRTEYLEEALELALQYEIHLEVLLYATVMKQVLLMMSPTDQEGSALQCRHLEPRHLNQF
jgi:hypothetical protein